MKKYFFYFIVLYVLKHFKHNIDNIFIVLFLIHNMLFQRFSNDHEFLKSNLVFKNTADENPRTNLNLGKVSLATLEGKLRV